MKGSPPWLKWKENNAEKHFLKHENSIPKP